MSCNKKHTSPHGLKQQDLFLTQALVGGLCSSPVPWLMGSWLPLQTNQIKVSWLPCQSEMFLEGFGPASRMVWPSGELHSLTAN